MAIFLVLVLSLVLAANGGVVPDPIFPSVKDDVYQQPVNFMAPMLKTPHSKDANEVNAQNKDVDGIPYFDFPKFEAFNREDAAREHNRIKRRAKRRGYKKYRRQEKPREPSFPEEADAQGRDHLRNATTPRPDTRRNYAETQQLRTKHKKKDKPDEYYNPPQRQNQENFVEMPKDLYQAHLRPGVIFRIHMAEAIIKMQYRNYGEDKDESVIEADVEYLRLTRKVINDEITKFEDLNWMLSWFNNRSDLILEHMCYTRYFVVGIPPTMFTHPEEYMKRICLFDTVYIDHIPYVVGEDNSLMAAVAPPVLHCDAATCTSVPFIDSMMFDEKLTRSNVRTVTRCQASCRSHCKNDADCLKRCSDRCLRA